ncbi:MAG: hypothetical protein RLZZ71_153 [Bacteroidota bacterium]|jgi:hypothetical protein
MRVIVIILPRGEAIRNFLYSGIVRKLNSEFKIILISIKPNEAIWQLLQSNSDVLIELKSNQFLYAYRLFFEIYDLAHNRYVWSEAAKVRWRMRDVEAKTQKDKIFRFLKKLIARCLANRISLQILDRIDFRMASLEPSVNEWVSTLKKYKIDLVFNSSHSHARNALPVVYAAKKLNIKTCTFLFSWDNLTSQGRVVPVYNYYFAWNNSIKGDFNEMYPNVPRQNVFVTGTPQFIGHFDKTNHLSYADVRDTLGLESNEQYFLYSSGMSHHLPEEPYVVARIADIIKSIGPNYRLVVRTYAKDRFDVFEKLKFERPDIIIPEVRWEKNFQTPLIEDQVFFSSLLKHCIAGINVASTISLELCMFDKPAINVAYNPPGKDISPYNYTRFYSFDHYKPIVESKAVELAENENQMLDLLKKAIENPESRKKERAELIHSFFGNKLDEGIADEFVNVFKRLLKDA